MLRSFPIYRPVNADVIVVRYHQSSIHHGHRLRYLHALKSNNGVVISAAVVENDLDVV